MPSLLIVPRDIMPGNPTRPAEYLAIAKLAAEAAGRTLLEDPRTLLPYVNAGMWKARCPGCGATFCVDPEWPVAVCMGTACFRVYRTFVWPQARRAIESVLFRRPRGNQHWGAARGRARDARVRAESVDDLQRENDAHREVLGPPAPVRAR